MGIPLRLFNPFGYHYPMGVFRALGFAQGFKNAGAFTAAQGVHLKVS